LKEGVVHQMDRARSRKQLIDALIQTGRAHLPAQVSRLAVLYTRGEGIQADIERVQSAFADVTPASEQFVIEVTPVIGAHFGPLAMGVVFA
jgi:fatty acid-binding protein DegV